MAESQAWSVTSSCSKGTISPMRATYLGFVPLEIKDSQCGWIEVCPCIVLWCQARNWHSVSVN